MSKKVIVEEKEVTCFEVIKVGPNVESFTDLKRTNALKSSFGRHVKFIVGPSTGADNFVELLQTQIKGLKDLAAIEVSPDLSETDIRLIIEKSFGKPVIQPQFSNSTFIRYISFGLGELTVQPINLSLNN